MGQNRDLSNGPGVMDIVEMMQAIGDFHQVDVILTMLPDGSFAGSRLRVTAIATRKNRSATEARNSVSRWRVFPSADARTMEGLLFRLLNELDRDCGEMWSQTELLGMPKAVAPSR